MSAATGSTSLGRPDSVRTDEVTLSVIRTELDAATATTRKYFFQATPLHGASSVGR